MKAFRILSILLIISLLFCSFVACSEEEDVDANIPDTPLYEVTVSFQIKNSDGRTLFEAVDYEYKWINEPTVLNVVRHFIQVEKGGSFIATDGIISRIGGLRIKKGEYVAMIQGTNINVKDILGDQSAQNKYFIDTSLNSYRLDEEGNCSEFTLVIAKF